MRMLRMHVLLAVAMVCGLIESRVCNRAMATPIDVAIIYNDDEIGELVEGLREFDDFGAIDLIGWSDFPAAAVISGYDAIVVTNRYKPIPNATQWGNLIADYAESGGGVTLGFGFFESAGPVVDYGRLEDQYHSPFTRGDIVSGDTSLGEVLIPSHPLMEGVDELTTSYRYDVTVNDGATVVANFQDGYPLAGYIDVVSGRVVAIQACYRTNPYFTNHGDFVQLYRNAIVYSVPEPATVLLFGLGGIALLRRRRTL